MTPLGNYTLARAMFRQIASSLPFENGYQLQDAEIPSEAECERTGDLGFRFDDELYVVGRKKDLLIVGGENIYPQDIEEIVAANLTIHDGRAVAVGIYNPNLGTEDIVWSRRWRTAKILRNRAEIERELRSAVVAGVGVAVRTILLKPPKWIVKSTAGKLVRSATREKLMKEHPKFNGQP